jgi:toxin ParE1/3/4
VSSFKINEKLFLLPAAQANIESTWIYTAEHWSLNQADCYMDNILDVCEALAEGSKQGQKFEQRMGYFRYAVGSHVIFSHDDGEVMRVVRILHSSIDTSQHP